MLKSLVRLFRRKPLAPRETMQPVRYDHEHDAEIARRCAVSLVGMIGEIEKYPHRLTKEQDLQLRIWDVQFGLLLKRLQLADVFQPKVRERGGENGLRGDWEFLPNLKLLIWKGPPSFEGGDFRFHDSTIIDCSNEWRDSLRALSEAVSEMTQLAGV